jgi:hypothetical protein
MATRQAVLQSLKSIAGASLFAVGLVLLFANLDGVVASLNNVAGVSAHEGLGVLPALGLAGLHALQAYTFDQTGFGSAFLQILVSFWPLILITIGGVMLLGAFNRRIATYQANAGFSARGDRS